MTVALAAGYVWLMPRAEQSRVVEVSFVEQAGDGQLWVNPLHPYTRELLSAIPGGGGDAALSRLMGPHRVGDCPTEAPGCGYLNRCSSGDEGCRASAPRLVDVGDGHLVACRKAEKG